MDVQRDKYNLRPGHKTHEHNTRSNRNKIGTVQKTESKSEYWNEQTRPGFDGEVYQDVLDADETVDWHDARQYAIYECPACGGSYPRKGDLQKIFPRTIPKCEKWITIDHITNWKEWILSKAGSSIFGITKKEAKDEYNNTENLKPLCSSCNSVKNGPRNKFD